MGSKNITAHFMSLFLFPYQRNIPLLTIVVIGLRKPYKKTEAGTSLVMNMFPLSLDA
jgi:hypothetical protein